MSPPLPPSPPAGPPRGMNFSRRNAEQPSPPSPALTDTRTSSTKCMATYCDVPASGGYPTIRPMARKGEETALGTARGRFIESLPRKAIELRGAIALLTATPAAEGPREDMRRRLHTLYASALVFRNDALAQAVKEGIDRLDAARDESRALSGDDLDHLTRLVKRIPDLKGDEAPGAAGAAASEAQPVATSVRPAPVPAA